MVDDWCRVTPGGVVLTVIVVPGASRARVVGIHGDRLKVAVAAPPERGRANRAVVELLATWSGLAANQVELVGGATSRVKTLRLVTASPAAAVALAQRLGGIVETA